MDDIPAILLVEGEADNRQVAAAILRAGGWRVDEADGGAEAIVAVRRHAYALVLLDMPLPDACAVAGAMRAEPGIGGKGPILAFTGLGDAGTIAGARAADVDGHIAKPFTPGDLIAAVAPWWPDDGYAAIDRLAAIFGLIEIDALLERLAAQLVDALALSDISDDLPGRAHRLAGLAGTLGFAALSRQWLAVSEGESVLGSARAETRKALAALARRKERATTG